MIRALYEAIPEVKGYPKSIPSIRPRGSFGESVQNRVEGLCDSAALAWLGVCLDPPATLEYIQSTNY